MLFFNHNGKTLTQGSPIIGADSRGLRYGDGVFETIKFRDGRLVLLDDHFSRLWKGLQMLKFQLPKLFTPEKLEDEVMHLLTKNKLDYGRVRITITRADGGLFDPVSHAPQYVIQTWEARGEDQLNSNGLSLCFYPNARKALDSFSNLKHNNFLPYLMGAIFAKEQQCNDAIILNSEGGVADTCIANIFAIKDNIIYTPHLEEGCVAGIMRKFIIRELGQNGFTVNETRLEKESLLAADEVFLTNSMFNMRWVQSLEKKKYTNLLTKEIYGLLSSTNPDVFC